MRKKYLAQVTANQRVQAAGNKAKNLQLLMQKGFLVPQTFVCRWNAYQDYCNNDLAMIETLKAELLAELSMEQAYAVRSSANMEDSVSHSFAGQFKSVLNVRGIDSLLHAVWSIWATTASKGVETYLDKKHSTVFQSLRMGVIIQKMVPPVISGVAFSKNPMTGMDEIVIEAVHGSGEALVQGGTTPLRWVYKWGQWITAPDRDEIDLAVIEEVAQLTRAISSAVKKDVDLEWVYDGEKVYWVQLREITSIQNIPVYSNKISKEQLPGIIKPLIWSINIPLVNGAWINVLTELIGKNDLTPENLARSFYYHAYYNMGVMGGVFNRLGFPHESLEMMMGIAPEGARMPSFKPNFKMMSLVPRLFRFMLDKLHFSKKIDSSLPKIKHSYQQYFNQPLEDLNEKQLLEKIDQLFVLNQETAYYNIVGPLLMMAYSGMLRSQLKRVGIKYEDFDVLIDCEDLKNYDPNLHLSRLNQLYRSLSPQHQEEIARATYGQFKVMQGIDSFKQETCAFVEHFGHLSDSGNDFSSQPWRENPDMILKLIINQPSPREKIYAGLRLEDIPFKGYHRWVFGHIYRRTREFRLYREHVSFVYTFGYGLFRDYFIALANRFVQRSLIAKPEDIFYLYFEEIRQIVEEGQPSTDFCQLIEKRRQEIEASRNVVLPSIIYGDQAPPLEVKVFKKMRGSPTSGGYCTGAVKVVRGIRDFEKLNKGDVLVVPFTDISWTPLFAQACGVISESGGMLSHSSIIAREYNIPAVVSVESATCLVDNTLVSIDGYKGEVIIHEDSTCEKKI